MNNVTGGPDQDEPAPAEVEANPYRYVIGIDGPAASGKSTVARRVADLLGATYLDTGALYRATTLAALRQGIPLDDGAALAAMSQGLPLSIENDGRVMLGKENVSSDIRGAAVDAAVSQVAAHPEVRRALLPLQRTIAGSGKPVVMVGRDITTVVAPGAGVKIFLATSAEERARRRHRELIQAGQDVSLEEVLADLQRRDNADSTREVAPLKTADDATVLNTDGQLIDQVVDQIAALVQRTWRSQLGLGP